MLAALLTFPAAGLSRISPFIFSNRLRKREVYPSTPSGMVMPAVQSKSMACSSRSESSASSPK